MQENLIFNILPLLGLVFIGYIGGRCLDIPTKPIGAIVIYIIAPIVNLGAVNKLDIQTSYFILPLVIFVTATSMCLAAYFLGKYFWKDDTPHLLGLGSVSTNSGYFGLALVLALLDEKWLGLYFLINIGISISELTVGFFIAARSRFSVKLALKKILMLPAIHAILFGLLLNYYHIQLPDVYFTYWDYAKGTWITLGMMMIGFAIAQIGHITIDFKLTSYLFAFRYIGWASCLFTYILLDMFYFKTMSLIVYQILFIYAVTPLPANSVAFASQFNLKAGQMGFAVLLSTIFSVFYAPYALNYFYKLVS